MKLENTLIAIFVNGKITEVMKASEAPEELLTELEANKLLEVPTACERLARGYEDLTSSECTYIFDTMYEATKENN